jgi:hypothetical protein
LIRKSDPYDLIKGIFFIMKQEIFLPILGYEDYYEISNLGNVKSKKRIIYKKNGAKQVVLERILNPTIGSHGYYSVGLCKYNVRKTKPIHHLVAESFLKHKVEGHKFVINHIDENKLNNRIENLEIVTKRDNTFLSKKILRNKESSKYIGVHYRHDRNCYVSRIRIGEKIIRKHFKTEEEANFDYITKKNKQNELQIKN